MQIFSELGCYQLISTDFRAITSTTKTSTSSAAHCSRGTFWLCWAFKSKAKSIARRGSLRHVGSNSLALIKYKWHYSLTYGLGKCCLGAICCWLEGSNFGSHDTSVGELPVLTRPQEVPLSLEVWLFIENPALVKYVTRLYVPVVKVILERRAVIHGLQYPVSEVIPLIFLE